MGRRIIRAAAALCLLVAMGGIARASHGGSEPTVVRGHVTNPYGAPIRPCVLALDRVLASNSDPVQPSRVSVIGAADGSYELRLPRPSIWLVQIQEIPEFSPQCAFMFWSPQKYDVYRVTIDTTSNTAPVDAVLRYYVDADVQGQVCLPSGCDYHTAYVRPGATIGISATLHREAGDRSTLRFRDPTSGETFPLTRYRSIDHGFDEYTGHATTPPDRPVGDFPAVFEAIDGEGVDATSPYDYTLRVDVVPPAVTDMYPRDGSAVYPDFFVYARVSDDNALASYGSRADIYDVTEPGMHDLVKSTGAGIYAGRVTSERFQLQPGHRYEAVLTVSDAAGNAAVARSTFTAGERDPIVGVTAPSGTVSDPFQQVSVVIGTAVDPATVRFQVRRLSDPKLTQTVTPSFDPATRTAYARPVDGPAGPGIFPFMLPFADGDYEVTLIAQAEGLGVAVPSTVWRFSVRLA